MRPKNTRCRSPSNGCSPENGERSSGQPEPTAASIQRNAAISAALAAAGFCGMMGRRPRIITQGRAQPDTLERPLMWRERDVDRDSSTAAKGGTRTPEKNERPGQRPGRSWWRCLPLTRTPMQAADLRQPAGFGECRRSQRRSTRRRPTWRPLHRSPVPQPRRQARPSLRILFGLARLDAAPLCSPFVALGLSTYRGSAMSFLALPSSRARASAMIALFCSCW